MEYSSSDKMFNCSASTSNVENDKTKANKLFRPWVTCHCLDCNLNIDSKKLVYVMKMALNNSHDKSTNTENRLLFRSNSVEDSSDNRSEADSTSTDRTIVYY